MTKPELLEVIKLLSALESWGFATKERVPDYLHDKLCETVDLLCKEVLK